MSSVTRDSASPHPPALDTDVDMDADKPEAKAVIVTNLTRNVVQAHLRTIFCFYGEIVKMDLPLFGKCVYICAKNVRKLTAQQPAKIEAKQLWNTLTLPRLVKLPPT